MTKVSNKTKTIIAKKSNNEKPSFSKTLGKTKNKVKNAARVEKKVEVKSPQKSPKKSDDNKKTTEKKSLIKSPKKSDDKKITTEKKSPINSPKKSHDEKKTTEKINSTVEEAVVGNLECTKAHVEKCVDAIFKIAAKDQEQEKSLLSDFNSPIFLQVNAVKVPKTPRRTVRIYLPHSMVGESDEVALIVPDVRKGLRQNYDASIDHWQTILREKNVTSIKEIIPMNKIKTEFRQYEEKLRLGKLFDFYLAEGRIAGHLTHFLGKTFLKYGKKPVPVKLKRDNLKQEIDNALKKTNFVLHGRGNTHIAQVGTCTMNENNIVDNVLQAVEEIKKVYPGGSDNIRSILIKTKLGMGIPIYYSMVNKNKVPVPVVKAKRPKAFKIVEGELTTMKGGAVVRVTPGGKVQKRKAVDKEKDSSDTVEAESGVEAKKAKIEGKKNKLEIEKITIKPKKIKVEPKVEKVEEKKLDTEKVVEEKKEEKKISIEKKVKKNVNKGKKVEKVGKKEGKKNLEKKVNKKSKIIKK